MGNYEKILNFLAQRPQAKLWIGLFIIVVILIIIASTYVLSARQQIEPELDQVADSTPPIQAEQTTPTPSPTAQVSTKPKSKSQVSKSPTAAVQSSVPTTTPSQASTQTTAPATASPVVDNTNIKTIASELKSLDLSGLSASLDGLEKSVGQFDQ